MANHELRPTASGIMRVLLLASCAALLAACGGGEGLAPDSSATQMTPRDQVALNRAMQANADALNKVKGERAARQAAR